ncbi:Hypothetical predicted protein, partial [Olea europaea subsp. europaea]
WIRRSSPRLAQSNPIPRQRIHKTYYTNVRLNSLTNYDNGDIDLSIEEIKVPP